MAILRCCVKQEKVSWTLIQDTILSKSGRRIYGVARTVIHLPFTPPQLSIVLRQPSLYIIAQMRNAHHRNPACQLVNLLDNAAERTIMPLLFMQASRPENSFSPCTIDMLFCINLPQRASQHPRTKHNSAYTGYRLISNYMEYGSFRHHVVRWMLIPC